MAADIFSCENAANLLKDKNVMFFGDSNIRSMYKDFVCLLSQNKLLEQYQLRGKLESSFMGDRLTQGGKLSNGTNYEEVREMKFNSGTCVSFSFLTRCYNKYLVGVLEDIRDKKRAEPDIIVINSCLWDVSRWGPTSVDSYRQNVPKLMELFKECLPEKTLVIWTTALPISAEAYGGFIVEEVEYMKHTLRYEVMEANIFTHDVVRKSGYNVLDLHYHMKYLMTMRVKDGIHWESRAVRYITNLLLTNIALLWNKNLPGNFTSRSLTSVVQRFVQEGSEVKLPEVPACLTISNESSNNVPPKGEENKIDKPKKKLPALTGKFKIQPQRDVPLEWNIDLENIPRISFCEDMSGERGLALRYLSTDYFTDIYKVLKKLKDACDSYKPPQWQDQESLPHRDCFQRLLRRMSYYTDILTWMPAPLEPRLDSSQLQFDLSGVDSQLDLTHSPYRCFSDITSSTFDDSAFWSGESNNNSCEQVSPPPPLLQTPNIVRYSRHSRRNINSHPYNQSRNRNLLVHNRSEYPQYGYRYNGVGNHHTYNQNHNYTPGEALDIIRNYIERYRYNLQYGDNYASPSHNHNAYGLSPVPYPSRYPAYNFQQNDYPSYYDENSNEASGSWHPWA